jgi:hypothetical protein
MRCADGRFRWFPDKNSEGLTWEQLRHETLCTLAELSDADSGRSDHIVDLLRRLEGEDENAAPKE